MADTPPSRLTDNLKPPRQQGKTVKEKRSAPSLSKSAIRDKIAEQVTLAGTLVGAGDPVGGFILLTQAESFAESWAEVAAVNPRVKRLLENWFSGSVYANAGAATAAIALPLATHYRVIPRSWFNPARDSVEQMETMVTDGATLGTMMQAYAKAQAEQQAAREAFDAMVKDHQPNGDGPVSDNEPDHYEAPA